MRMVAVGLMCLIACGATNHNKNGDSNKATRKTPVWYCHTVSGAILRPQDGRETCSRKLVLCEQSRAESIALGLQAGSCTTVEKAVCYPIHFKKHNHTVERCFLHGEECERVRSYMVGDLTLDVRACAEESNELPPTGGVH